MKKKSILFFALLCCTLVSCWHRKGNISIQYNESKHSYSMEAWFDEGKTRAVEEYMDDKIGSESNMSFVNTRLDGTIGLDDHTRFFIKKSPGHLKIQLDKNKNSEDSYLQIKSLCQGIKEVVK